ncbi:Alpha-1,3-mannosyl-glycoprotein 2-beta-N-acetylglucosaminyltransferase [Toxocara canis]|uniref:Alpha-1,3-mannosyl-glycoprotein 2-beta-N-acetylglucosaminyltransferase n=1 Tax=Toxocara canis TaxID=6265 RepID=A0A0B2VN72_TOXCA|nr:Alpha-1,3-mannosyl-glycoprotein 2-beta-N-acetylglucosaminyltransferase [Toxocara canis]
MTAMLQPTNRCLMRILAVLLLLAFIKKAIYCPLKARRISEHIRRQLYEIYRVEHPEATAARVTLSPSRKVARIAVNVIACDRTAELKNLLNDISRLLPKSDQFGVFVSLGCDNDASRQVAEQFANFVVLEPEWRNATRDRESIRNSHAPPKRAKSTAYLARLSPQHREALLKDGGFYEYNRVSNQYKYSLTYSFDIFDYDYALFIEGVGWMISSSTWSDLIDEWPEVFWDEWVRATMHRQKKACIRPEVSRIAITDDSFSSRDILAMEPYDLFKYITLNAEPYDFTSANLNYLLREQYDDELDRRISEAIMIEENDITKGVVNRYKSSLKIYYSTESQFKRLSAAFKYVPYSQGGVCATCYKGILQLRWHSSFIYIIRKDSAKSFFSLYDFLLKIFN